MQLNTFTYTKADGTTSKRVLATMHSPTKFYSGTDISELSTEDQALYLVELDKLHSTFTEQVLQLNNKFDLNHRYRQFDASKITDLKTETI